MNAEVRYGDTAIPANRVGTSFEAGRRGEAGRVRVRADVPVNEPVVTVRLRADCAGGAQRLYTLLADPVATPALAAAPVRQVRPARITPAPRMAVQQPAPRSPEAPVFNSASGPALLRASFEMRSSPAADEATRSAAAALWRALGASPAAAAQSTQQLQRLEGTVAQLRDTGRTTSAEVGRLGNELRAAREGRNTVVALLALALLIAAAWAWRLHRRDRKPEPLRSHWIDSLDHDAPARRSAPVRIAVPSQALAQADAQESQPWHEEPRAVQGRVQTLQQQTDALLEAQEQADFFLSLGQHEDAVNVLENYVREHDDACAYGYLQLFELYRQLGARRTYVKLAARFEQVFGFEPPGFDAAPGGRRGLQDYSAPIAHVCSAWPTADGHAAVQELLLRRPESRGDLMDLQAYADLLWLFAVRKEEAQPRAEPLVPLDLSMDAAWPDVDLSGLPPARAIPDDAANLFDSVMEAEVSRHGR